jgi:hypothetical protein
MGLSLADIEKKEMAPKKAQKRTTTKGRKPAIDEGTDDNRPEIKTPSVVDIRTPTTAAIITPGSFQIHDIVSENDDNETDNGKTNNETSDDIGTDNNEVNGKMNNRTDNEKINYDESDDDEKNSELDQNEPFDVRPIIAKPVVFPVQTPPKKKYNKLIQFRKTFKRDSEFIYKFLPIGIKSDLDKDKSLENLQGDKLIQARSLVFYNWMNKNPTKIGNFFDELAKKQI